MNLEGTIERIKADLIEEEPRGIDRAIVEAFECAVTYTRDCEEILSGHVEEALDAWREGGYCDNISVEVLAYCLLESHGDEIADAYYSARLYDALYTFCDMVSKIPSKEVLLKSFSSADIDAVRRIKCDDEEVRKYMEAVIHVFE